jgi:hypothetical protein
MRAPRGPRRANSAGSAQSQEITQLIAGGNRQATSRRRHECTLSALNERARQRHQRRVSTVAYVVILVLVALVSLAAWQVFGERVKGTLFAADQRLNLLDGMGLGAPIRGAHPAPAASVGPAVRERATAPVPHRLPVRHRQRAPEAAARDLDRRQR